MKKRVFIWMPALIILLPLAYAQYSCGPVFQSRCAGSQYCGGINLIRNGGFEADADNNNVPDGFNTSTPSQVSIDSNEKYTGSKSVKVSGIWNSIDYPVTLPDNTDYIFSAMVKGNCNILKLYYGPAAGTGAVNLCAAKKESKCGSVAPQEGWKKIVAQFNTGALPKQPNNMLRLECHDEGRTFWIDSIVLERKPLSQAEVSLRNDCGACGCPEDKICAADGSCIGGERQYIYAGSKRIAYKEDGQVFYLHEDHLGTVSAVTDSTGKTVTEAKYGPFGKEISLSGRPDTFKFTGKELDADTGLYYFGARYYDPAVGRFISTDPAMSGINAYAYAGNNPLRMVDPDGREEVDTMADLFYGTNAVEDPMADLFYGPNSLSAETSRVRSKEVQRDAAAQFLKRLDASHEIIVRKEELAARSKQPILNTRAARNLINRKLGGIFSGVLSAQASVPKLPGGLRAVEVAVEIGQNGMSLESAVGIATMPIPDPIGIFSPTAVSADEKIPATKEEADAMWKKAEEMEKKRNEQRDAFINTLENTFNQQVKDVGEFLGLR